MRKRGVRNYCLPYKVKLVKMLEGPENNSHFKNIFLSSFPVDGPSDVKVQVKGTVRINCTVLWDPAFELEVNWKKDNVDLVTDGIKATIDPLDKFLTIRDLTFADSGKKRKP